MAVRLPEYLFVEPERLGEGTPVKVRIVEDGMALARQFAEDVFHAVEAARESGKTPVMILPVGPVDQFAPLAEMINQRRADWRDVVLINMDEYLTDEDRWIEPDHPLSFRGFMERNFYDRLDPELAPLPENRVFPDPSCPEAVARLVERHGGVDVCFGGIGINGHVAFNEPPEPGESLTVDQFAALPTRVLSLSRETRTINSVTVGGEIGIVPRRAVTVGMREILSARQCRFYCNRPWQRAVVRRVLHGPIEAACPASLLRLHDDAQITVTRFVAEKPDIRLR